MVAARALCELCDERERDVPKRLRHQVGALDVPAPAGPRRGITQLAAVYAGPNDPANQDPTPFQTGSRLVVQAMLLSPNFLYQLETQAAAPPAQPAPPSPYEIATRLSMLLWKAGPDVAQLDAAAAGKMAFSADIAAQVGPMLADPRARRGVRAFVDDWLGVYVVPNRTLVGGLTTTVLADMRSETLRFVERLAIDDKADLMQVFLDKKTELSPELAKLYGLTPTGTAPTAVYNLGSNPNRIGVLTQPAVLGVRAGPAAASIAQRGHWILNTILCRDIAPPTQAALDLGAKVQASLPPPPRSEISSRSTRRSEPLVRVATPRWTPWGFRSSRTTSRARSLRRTRTATCCGPTAR